MKATRIDLHSFDEVYGEIVPFVFNVEIDSLVRHLIDDINGLFDMPSLANEGGKVDFSKISNTLEYLLTSTDHLLSDNSRTFLLTATVALLNLFIDEFLQTPQQINHRFKYIKSTSYVDGRLSILLERYTVSRLSDDVAEEHLLFCQTVVSHFGKK